MTRRDLFKLTIGTPLVALLPRKPWHQREDVRRAIVFLQNHLREQRYQIAVFEELNALERRIEARRQAGT